MIATKEGSTKSGDVKNEIVDEPSDELDDVSLASVAGGINWHPQKDDRIALPAWDKPDEW